LITGASGGFGRAWSRAALARGDRVVGTSRDPGRLEDLAEAFGEAFLPLELDVVDRAAAFDAVHRAHAHLGRLDILVNLAGYGQYGVVEEVTEREARRQFDTNFFGALWVTQAALPIMRAQRAGHIVQVSSIGGHVAGPSLGMYCSSKWALEAVSQSLAGEIAEFGISVTLIEPSAFATGAEASAREPSAPNAAYAAAHERLHRRRASNLRPDADLGDPHAAADALLAVVDAQEPPLRVVFGPGGLAVIEAEYEQRLAHWRAAQPYTDLSARLGSSPS
jgi:NAD(P)-dependent dehydrogenase (short-subunit alcohol dehydrogenase family)